ncbi:unnamed protein product [Ranitomeya imitator]|uniref:Mucin-like protein n=1 Tax=Ranitomeya imitator TaxID=111125 RepID=A0ABN9MQM4_9NEOB|nr:unnamed protein product [Ranitomeya imitator]
MSWSCDRDVITGPALIPTMGPEAAMDYKGPSERCDCKPGYEEDDNNNCIDVNECANITSPCAANANCTNLLGNFSCLCIPGYEGDGRLECTAITTTTVSTWTTPSNNETYSTIFTTISTTSSTTGVVNASIPLFPYGASVRDTNYNRRTTDFTSPVFQPQIGFPFGNSLRNFVYEYTNNDGIVIPEVENIISRNLKISYTAQWTLKITWENVPAYPAKESDNRFALDRRGLWIYQLNNSTVENSRMKCLSWFNNQHENPSQWNSGLLSCPCLFQQAQADSRYRQTKAGESSYIKLFRSTSPNWYYADVQDAELQAYDWCCNDVDDPQFCTMYKQKRPPINCLDYRPPRPGWMFGDPHITTLDGLSYTFNGLGDFLLLNASDSDISLVLQGRTVQTEQANATNFQAFAVQYTSSNASVKVEWYLGNSNNINAFLDGQDVLFSYSEVWKFFFTTKIKKNLHMFGVYELIMTWRIINADMEAYIDDTNSAVFFKNDSFNDHCNLPRFSVCTSTWNNDQSDDFFFNNGTKLPINSSEEEIFYYGMEWEVNESSLFKEPHTQGKDSFMPVFLRDLRDLYKDQYAELEEKCGNKTECIYDALATNNTELGLETMKVSLQLEETNITLHAAAPPIAGNLTIEAFIYSTVTVQYTATGTGVVFSADPDTNTDIDLSDIDECESNSPCSPDAVCENGIGNFTCTCKAGYTGAVGVVLTAKARHIVVCANMGISPEILLQSVVEEYLWHNE